MKKPFMHRKHAEATLWFLVSAVLSIAVCLIMIQTGHAVASGSYFERLNLAKDVSLALKTFSGLPGQGSVAVDLKDYSLAVSKTKIIVFSVEKQEVSAAIVEGDFPVEVTLHKAGTISINKHDDHFSITRKTAEDET